MADAAFEALVEEAAVQMAHGGAFLVTGDLANPMTIGWCQWGRLWNRPVCTVFVRHSRYSHGLISSGRFTVSIPKAGTMQKELAYCGTKSYRDGDKLAALGLTLVPSQTEGVPGIAGCAIHFECKVLMQQEADYSTLAEPCRHQFYDPATQAGDDGDPHTIYFAEILAAYRE